MPDRFTNSARTLIAAVLCSLAPIPAAHGQTAPPSPAQFDPSDVYFQGYLAARSAEQLESTGDFTGALQKLEKASELFDAVRSYHPDWKPGMVGGRSEKTNESIRRIRPLAEQAMNQNRNAVAELEGGVRKPTVPAEASPPRPPATLRLDPPAASELKDAESEVRRLRAMLDQLSKRENQNTAEINNLTRQRDELDARLRQTENRENPDDAKRVDELTRQRDELQARLNETENRQNPDDAKRVDELTRQRDELQARLNETETRENARNASRVNDLRRQRDELQARLREAETTAQALRARLMAAPVESEMAALNHRIETLEQERAAMAMALTQSRGAHTEAIAGINTLQADLKVMRQKQADLERDLKTERQVANSVVAGQRRQLDALERELKHKNDQLEKANERIAGLMTELRESRDAYAQLRDERDSLLQERDQMAALLKLNEAGRIQDLIEQNMALAKNLREANEKVDRLFRESNADKDAYTEALRDLAIAKSQINHLHQEKREQDRRLADLENRLKNEEQALAAGQVAADPAEIELLKDIIRRQLRVQERRRQARELLIDAARELGANDERLAQAIELFNAQEIALSPEEQKLIADRQVDGEFVSPFARDRTSVGIATSELNRDIAVFERTAEKSFVAGRMVPARELYQMILDQHPGHTPSLCKLGVVHLRLDEPETAADAFRRAVELDSSNAYAHRMLGFSLMKLGDLPAAEQAVRQAVELSPTDAKSQILLATLCYRLGRSGEAESRFKAAINADPMPSEPYYNLALLCSRDRRIEDAREYYQKALERGALPDPALEKKLSNQ